MRLPENWERVPIKAIYDGLYDGPHATPKPSEDGPIFLGIGNVTEDGHLDYSKVRHISEDDYPKWTKRVTPQRGDIVFTYEATLNRYAIIPEGFRGCLGRRMALIRPNTEKVDTRFLHYYFFSKDWRETIEANKLAGATVDRVPLTQFPEFPISLPPLTIQQRISAILSAYDDLIENNTRRIEILEEMARRLYEEWFVHFRFPGHEEVSFKESELGEIPEGWEVRRLEDTVALNPRTKVPKDGEKWFVPMGALSESSMIVGSLERKPGNSGAKFQNGDTLVARITPCLENGKTGFVDFLPEDQPTACGSTEFIVLRSISLCPEMVYLLARSDRFRDVAIKSMSGATGRQRVRVESLVEFPVVQPDNATLEAFQRFVSPCFKQARTLALKNRNLRTQRDLLLPKLVSGEIDVSDITMPEDKEVEAA
ncbi:MAG: type I restriction enzyme, S subunit [Halomonas sp. HL-48]|nr:restriction endonuclease subunit S [Halomonas sp. HL-48]KPQ24896.1 MAG: type I restriction enzyme, S subunit [Halomonas sp. HL-48]